MLVAEMLSFRVSVFLREGMSHEHIVATGIYYGSMVEPQHHCGHEMSPCLAGGELDFREIVFSKRKFIVGDSV